MKFGVFTDLHYDSIPDGDKRVEDLIKSFSENNVEFVIDLGDSLFAKEENQVIIKRFKRLPCYFSIGNHNIDLCSKDVALNFLGLKRGHYSFVRENIKFIFLDANYVKTVNGIIPEDEKLKTEVGLHPYVPDEQIEWLKSELCGDKFYYIVCTHQSLSNDLMIGNHSRGIVNSEEIRLILEKRNADKKKVLFCMNGHDHGDSVRLINGIYYYSLNSASHIWQPKEIYKYDANLHERFPNLKNYIMYKDVLHIIISINEQMDVDIKGMESDYQKLTPGDLWMDYIWNNVSILPRISSLHIEYK